MKDYKEENLTLLHGDCLDRLKEMDDNSVHSIVTDPPYGLSFMGKKWDYEVPSVEIWEECLRVLKPGGHLLSFAGTRTQHRMAVNIEDAGFEIRDMIAWVYGSGFPKSHNISKAIDKYHGAEREVVGKREHPTLKDKSKVIRKNSTQHHANNVTKDEWDITESATDEAKQWDGWGTALKPALEPITMARKPLSEKTIVENVLEHGTGGINIDDSRVVTTDVIEQSGELVDIDRGKCAEGYDRPNSTMYRTGKPKERGGPAHDSGRFPANFIHDGSEEVEDCFPHTKSGKDCKRAKDHQTGSMGGTLNTMDREEISYGDEGSASRFFYCAKASKSEKGKDNTHPTVKPVKLMEYLVTLVTPKGGVILDPFLGSGTTGVACKNLDINFVGIERDEDYFELAKNRITKHIINDGENITVPDILTVEDGLPPLVE